MPSNEIKIYKCNVQSVNSSFISFQRKQKRCVALEVIYLSTSVHSQGLRHVVIYYLSAVNKRLIFIRCTTPQLPEACVVLRPLSDDSDVRAVRACCHCADFSRDADIAPMMHSERCERQRQPRDHNFPLFTTFAVWRLYKRASSLAVAVAVERDLTKPRRRRQ